jgi:hypothetical protein
MLFAKDSNAFARTRKISKINRMQVPLFTAAVLFLLFCLWLPSGLKTPTLELRKESIGKSFKEIHQYLEPIEAGAAAAIALKIVFDKVFAYREKE